MADDAIEWGKEPEKEIILKERQGNFWRHWVYLMHTMGF